LEDGVLFAAVAVQIGLLGRCCPESAGASDT